MKTSSKLIYSYIFLLLICTGCNTPKCEFDTKNCQIIVSKGDFIIKEVLINRNRERYIVYDLKSDKVGNTNFNLCTPDSVNYFPLLRNGDFYKNGSYYIVVRVNTTPEDGNHDKVFTFEIYDSTWKEGKILMGIPLRI